MPERPNNVTINGIRYRVGGLAQSEGVWRVEASESEEGDPLTERMVRLGRGAAGLIGSRRHSGYPAADGVSDVDNGDTSLPDSYGPGPLVTLLDLSEGNGFYSPGIIDETLIVDGLGSAGASIDGSLQSGEAVGIFAAGDDDNDQPTRYVYALVGGRLHVLDPATDALVESVTLSPSVTGGDVAAYAGTYWLALEGAEDVDFVRYLVAPYTPTTATQLGEADFSARRVAAGPGFLHFAQQEGANVAIVRRTAETVVADIATAANLAPTDGDTVGDPDAAITRLAVAGERLLIGKEDGLHEYDRNLIARQYNEWMRGIRWILQCNGILPIGLGGENITTFRRGLWMFPLNRSIGTEQLAFNDSDKRGRYTELAFDGTFIWAFQYNADTGATHIIKMRDRQLAGPGFFEHHPQATIEDAVVRKAFIWPGCTADGVTIGPRLYFSAGVDTIGYIRLGESQPDQSDANARFNDGEWTITWPYDDFGHDTPKQPHRLQARYRNVEGTAGIRWEVSPGPGLPYVPLTDNGQRGGAAAVRRNGIQRRYGPRDGAGVSGDVLSYRMIGSGSSQTARQAVEGEPTVTILEQPRQVLTTTAALQCGGTDGVQADEAWRNLLAVAGQVVEVVYDYGDDRRERRPVRIKAVRQGGTTGGGDAEGVIVAGVTLREVDYGG